MTLREDYVYKEGTGIEQEYSWTQQWHLGPASGQRNIE